MLLKTYYHVKPFIPRWMQIRLRRAMMKRRLTEVSSVWPIDQRAGQSPANWPGWPEDKKFAFVLTHDVEGQRGCTRCLDVAALEQKHGFRSSFNFVADEYHVPSELRLELLKRGFEVGLHGLTHDGHLYRSRSHFLKQATRINKVLKEWQAVGFRSPAMHRNYEWIGDLDIEYDASTFDTDPFEPQPEGAGTIFPFLVRTDSSKKSYIELPYTLPQDFALFVLLKERNIDIWKRKLDWVVERGGMVLVITHPDYMVFGDARPRIEEYSSRLYEELLRYVHDTYAGQYWNALPREVARHWVTTGARNTPCDRL